MFLPVPPALQAPAPRPAQQAADFDEAFAFLQATYAWGDRVEWELLKAEFRPKALAAHDDRAFHRVLEDLLDQLADAHTHLGSNLADSWRLPPYDVAAEWRDEHAVITAVLPGSLAEQAGLRAGMKVLGVGGKPLKEALERRRPTFLKGLEDEDLHWMLNSLLAGKRGEARVLKVQGASGGVREVTVPEGPAAAWPEPETRLLPGDIGLIAFTDFGSEAAVKRMDDALERFPQARAWILDVRYNSGGDTAFMKPVAARFFSRRARFAMMRKREGNRLGAPWEEFLMPRGKAFEGPVSVLVSPWTMSVAEGLALAFQGTLRGMAVGTRMAGLGAAVQSLTLKHSGLRVQVSAEPVYDLFLRPRSALRPKVPVDLATAKGSDPILDAAVAWLTPQLGKR